MASLQQVLAHLEPQADDPSCGFITAADIRAALTILYTEMEKCCAKPTVDILNRAGDTPGIPHPEPALGSVTINTADGITWMWDGTGWQQVAKRVPLTHFGQAGQGAPHNTPQPPIAGGPGDKYLDATPGVEMIYRAIPDPANPGQLTWEAVAQLGSGDQFFDIQHRDIYIGA